MTTEYYQIPSQQGFLPLPEDTADPWLAAATSSLSINDWGNKEKQVNPPSLFEPEDAEASVSWKNVVPKQYNKAEVRAPVAPKQFNSTTSKIDAWGVVNNITATKQQKKAKTQQNKAQPAKQAKPAKQQQQQQQQQEDANGKPIEDELSGQNVSLQLNYCLLHYLELLFKPHITHKHHYHFIIICFFPSFFTTVPVHAISQHNNTKMYLIYLLSYHNNASWHPHTPP